MAKECFLAYHSYLEALEALSDAECGRLFKACLQYSKSGEAPELSGNERILFPSWKSQIDRDSQKYNKTCETNAKNGKMGANNRWRTVANANERHEVYGENSQGEGEREEEDKGKDKRKKKDAIASKKEKPLRSIIPPTVDMVDAYCAERGNGISGQKFVDWYAVRGWMVGKGKMVDWQAAIRTWENREKESDPGGIKNGDRREDGRVYMDGKWVQV